MAVKKIHGPKLFKWQMETMKLYQAHPRGSIITVKSPRQRGKSMFVETLVAMESINHRNFKIFIVMPSYLSAKKMYKELTASLDACSVVKSKSAQFFDIELLNGSTISLRSIQSGDALRGATANLLIIDEASFVPLDVAMETVFPFVNATNGNIVLTSTPKLPDRESNLFAKFYFSGLEGEKDCYSIDWCDFDTTALMSPSRIELYKKSMSWNIFANEILGEFLDLKNELWDIQPILTKAPGLITPGCVAGVDFSTGSNNDETAISVFNSSNQMVRLSHFSDKSPTDTISFLVNMIEQLGITRCAVEVNSLGQVYLDMLKKAITARKLRCQILPFLTTNSSKREVIEQMQVEIANQAFTLLDENMLKTEFASFVMKSTKSGLITYENLSNSVHDDIVISVALARWAARKNTYIVR